MSTSALLSLGITILLIILLPFILFLALRKKHQLMILPLVTGIAVFLIFVLLRSLVFDSFMLKFFPSLFTNPLLYTLYICLVTTFFEEFGRYFGFLFLKRNQRIKTLGTPFSYGIGHGGIEAILFAAPPLLSSLFLGLQLISKDPTSIIASVSPEKQAAVQDRFLS